MMRFSSPAVIPARMLFGWRPIAKDPWKFQLTQVATESLLAVDKDLLREFIEYYPDHQDTLIRQIGASQILRHYRGLRYLLREQRGLPSRIYRQIAPFLHRDIRMLETGTI